MKQFDVRVYPLAFKFDRCLMAKKRDESAAIRRLGAHRYPVSGERCKCLRERAIENLCRSRLEREEKEKKKKRLKEKKKKMDAYVPYVGDFRDLTHCSLWVEHDHRVVIYTK